MLLKKQKNIICLNWRTIYLRIRVNKASLMQSYECYRGVALHVTITVKTINLYVLVDMFAVFESLV